MQSPASEMVDVAAYRHRVTLEALHFFYAQTAQRLHAIQLTLPRTMTPAQR